MILRKKTLFHYWVSFLSLASDAELCSFCSELCERVLAQVPWANFKVNFHAQGSSYAQHLLLQ